jgi:uncharacterized repeat protein (TIGR03803 family)
MNTMISNLLWRSGITVIVLVFSSMASGPSFAQALSTPAAVANAVAPEAPAAVPPPGAHLTYYGGPVASNLQVVQVIWGPECTGTPPCFLPQVTSTATPSIATFYQEALNSSYVDWLSEYDTIGLPAPTSNQIIGRGSFAGQYPITPNNPATSLSDTDIQNEIAAQIAAGHLPAPVPDAQGNPNTYYAVFFPHGTKITDVNGKPSCLPHPKGFCAYHNSVAVPPLAAWYYGVHPDMQTGSGCDVNCGSTKWTPFERYTLVASHEMVETITDPVTTSLAWYDEINNGEIGDLCRLRKGLVVGSDGQTYTVQQEWSNLQGKCVVAGPRTVLHSFDGTDGAYPSAGLIQATNGDLYGTTAYGGLYDNTFCAPTDCGTVFKITPSGTLTTLYSFCLQANCTDGLFPQAPLIQATNGDFYGTTCLCGDNSNEFYGTIFKMTPSGTLTTLHSFKDVGGDQPSGLIQADNGDLYGTTQYGGNGYGTVFKMTPGGTLTTLHSFTGADGATPVAGLIQATDGNLYGTTDWGGANCDGGVGCGTVFKITRGGTLTTLHIFNGSDGSGVLAGLIQATDGNFYGTTIGGGAAGYGTVFKITPSGSLTTLYSFCSQTGCTDGGVPYAGLIQATDGNFYGSTLEGGANGYGTVFKITPSGSLTTLDSSCSQTGCTDGKSPGYAGLIQATDGNLYGVSGGGGANDVGTVFRISLGLAPFVETQTTSGKVGAAVKILGNTLTGASSVTFNGTAATFTVVSKSEIKTTVPAGATSGYVKVTTPGGTLTSNVVYTVKP